MIVRLRLGRAARAEVRPGKNKRAALAVASLLSPVAVMASVLGVWRLAADLKMAGDFAIANGLFSHWQVWIATGLMLAFLARLLNRYGRADDTATL